MTPQRGHGFELLPKSSRSVWVSWLAHKSLGLSIGAGMVAVCVAQAPPRHGPETLWTGCGKMVFDE